jgi:hypothetical protein
MAFAIGIFQYPARSLLSAVLLASVCDLSLTKCDMSGMHRFFFLALVYTFLASQTLPRVKDRTSFEFRGLIKMLGKHDDISSDCIKTPV